MFILSCFLLLGVAFFIHIFFVGRGVFHLSILFFCWAWRFNCYLALGVLGVIIVVGYMALLNQK